MGPRVSGWGPTPPILPSLVCLLAGARTALSRPQAATANGGRPTALPPRDGFHSCRVDAVDSPLSSRIADRLLPS